jgi:hypothetical protein
VNHWSPRLHRLTIATACASLVALSTAGRASAEDLRFNFTVDGHDGERTQIRIQVPLKMVQRLAPHLTAELSPTSRLRINGHRVTHEDARELWRAVREVAHDGGRSGRPFLDVRSGRDTVRVSLDGRYVQMRAIERRGWADDDVTLRVPVRVVDALLSGGEGRLEFGAALSALALEGAGDLLRIEADDADVRVWVDSEDE